MPLPLSLSRHSHPTNVYIISCLVTYQTHCQPIYKACPLCRHSLQDNLSLGIQSHPKQPCLVEQYLFYIYGLLLQKRNNTNIRAIVNMANPHREPSAAGSSATYRLGCDVWQLICQDLSLAITQATTEEEAQTSRAMLKALSETDRMLHDLSAPYLLRHPRFGRMTDQTEEHQSHGELVRAQLDSMALSPIFPQPPR